MPLYCRIHLHATSSYVAIVDEQRKRISGRNLRNDPSSFCHSLLHIGTTSQASPPNRPSIGTGLSMPVLMEHGRAVHLAKPCAIKQYAGLKYVHDKHEAFWLADLLSLGMGTTNQRSSVPWETSSASADLW